MSVSSAATSSLRDTLENSDATALTVWPTHDVPDVLASISDARQRAFLLACARTPILTKACHESGITLFVVYSWKQNDPVFAEAFKLARQLGVIAGEDEAWRRAIDGVEEPVFDKHGDEVGVKIKHSDTLMMFLLKGANPEKYRERVEHSGANGGPIDLRITRRVLEPDGSVRETIDVTPKV